VSSIDIAPNSDATDLNGSDKRCSVLGIPGSDATPSFQVQERVFHQMTQFVKVAIVVPDKVE